MLHSQYFDDTFLKAFTGNDIALSLQKLEMFRQEKKAANIDDETDKINLLSGMLLSLASMTTIDRKYAESILRAIGEIYLKDDQEEGQDNRLIFATNAFFTKALFKIFESCWFVVLCSNLYRKSP